MDTGHVRLVTPDLPSKIVGPAARPSTHRAKHEPEKRQSQQGACSRRAWVAFMLALGGTVRWELGFLVGLSAVCEQKEKLKKRCRYGCRARVPYSWAREPSLPAP